MLPLVRPNEYLIVKQCILTKEINISEISENYANIALDSLEHALKNLKKKNIIENPMVDLRYIGSKCKNIYWISSTMD